MFALSRAGSKSAIDSTAMAVAADAPKPLSFRGKTDKVDFLPDLNVFFARKSQPSNS
jgi:hypothetical protein